MYKYLNKYNQELELVKIIVQSKRLLADHLEDLEQCHVKENDINSNSYRKLYWSFGLMSVTLCSMKFCFKTPIIRSILTLSSAIGGTYFLVETVSLLKKNSVKNRLFRTLYDLNDIDASIRKNISYFREVYFLRKNQSNDDEMLKNCIKNVIEIIKLIYEDTKYLERIKLPTDVEEMYQPLEDLSNCEYFQKNLDDSSTQDIKDFFNLFLYFQSQYLLRLCLILVNDKSIAIDYIQNESIMLHNKLQIKIDSLSSPLEFKVTKQTLAEKMEKIQENKCIEIDSASLAKLKRCSADLSYRLIAITREFQWTDESIQVINKQNLTDKEKFEKIFENLVTTEEAIVAHLDDYRRMKLMFYKFIFTNFNLKLEEVNDEKSDGESIDRDEEGENISGKDENSDSGSDFFALRDSVENSSDEESFPNRKQKIEDELQEFDYKIARTNFAPVLKQLKNKIDPLKDEMKERELKFLLAKGFDRERILNSVEGIVNKSEESGSDSGSSLDDFSCPKKSQRNFDEMREFLQSKQQMLILPTMMPNPSMGEEEILE